MFYLENKNYDAVSSSIYNIFVYATEFFSVCDIFARGWPRFLFQSTRISMEYTSTTRTPGLLITFPTTKKLSTSSKITKGTLLSELYSAQLKKQVNWMVYCNERVIK